jgi:hypothetical protein
MKSHRYFFLTGIIIASFFYTLPCFAATMSLPSRGPYSVGQTFSLPVYVSTTPSSPLNAVAGTINYPTDKLQLISVSKSSLINFWTQDPVVSAGAVTFEGGIYNPGFPGVNGTVLSITFKVLSTGSAPLTFSSASILANDGQGTNILDSANGTTIVLGGGVDTTVTPVVAPTPAPAAPTSRGPIITSTTHPDQTAWYNVATVDLSWKNPSAASAVRVGYDTSSKGTPSVVYAPLISHKTIKLDDGILYFHVQEKINGEWGPISTFKIQIDTVPPLPMHLVFSHGATTSDPRPSVVFATSDDLSGIAYYDIFINGTQLTSEVTPEDIKTNPYVLPAQDPGTGTIKVIAYDQAGNSTTVVGKFEVVGLRAPKVNPISDLVDGDVFEVSGLTDPASRVDVFLKDANGTVTSEWARSSDTGAFRVVWDKRLQQGVYSVTAQTTDDKGAKSAMSQKISFQVKPQPWLTFGWLTLNIFSLIILILALLALLAFITWYLWHRFHAIRHRVLHAISPTHRAIRKDFDDLKTAIIEEVTALEEIRSKRQLTSEEDRMIERFSALIDESQAKVEKQIERLEKSGKRGPHSHSMGDIE